MTIEIFDIHSNLGAEARINDGLELMAWAH